MLIGLLVVLLSAVNPAAIFPATAATDSSAVSRAHTSNAFHYNIDGKLASMLQVVRDHQARSDRSAVDGIREGSVVASRFDVAANGAPNPVYRGLAEGEDAALGLVARNPGAGNSVASHVAGARDTQWISTTRSEALASGKYGQYGYVRIDLNKVGSEVVDVSNGIPGMPRNYMLSRWARNAQEVLIRGNIPPGAIG